MASPRTGTCNSSKFHASVLFRLAVNAAAGDRIAGGSERAEINQGGRI
jgi:hypothetical protein